MLIRDREVHRYIKNTSVHFFFPEGPENHIAAQLYSLCHLVVC